MASKKLSLSEEKNPPEHKHSVTVVTKIGKIRLIGATRNNKDSVQHDEITCFLFRVS